MAWKWKPGSGRDHAYPSNFCLMFRVLEAMFVVGITGCLIVIPIAAYRMFAVLFEKSEPDETEQQ